MSLFQLLRPSLPPTKLTPPPPVPSQGLLLLQLGCHSSQAAAAEAEREEDPHRGLGESSTGTSCPEVHVKLV